MSMYSQPTQPITVYPVGREQWPFGAIPAVAGGVLAIVGALISWVSLTVEPLRAGRRGAKLTFNGVDLADGKVVVVAAVVAVAAAVVAWFIHHRETGIVLGIVAAVAGLVITVLPVIDAISPSRSLAAVGRQVAASSNISAQRAEAALRVLSARGGVMVSPQFGLFLAILGGLLALTGGIAVAARSASFPRGSRRS